ncbi:hypothetical protein [Corynebacterium kalinowskii]|nr:hypothetical protein [Corynebacterium kalinowskii]
MQEAKAEGKLFKLRFMSHGFFSDTEWVNPDHVVRVWSINERNFEVPQLEAKYPDWLISKIPPKEK